MEYLTQTWTQLGPFFPKLGYIFQFSKKRRVAPALAEVTYFIFYIFDRALNMPQVLNVRGF